MMHHILFPFLIEIKFVFVFQFLSRNAAKNPILYIRRLKDSVYPWNFFDILITNHCFQSFIGFIKSEN